MAGSQLGLEFVQDLAAATGADVAASTDLTGPARLGGDWDLEFATGVIDVDPLSSGGSGSEFEHVLADITVPGVPNQNNEFRIYREYVTLNDGEPEDFGKLASPKSFLFQGQEQKDEFQFRQKPYLSTDVIENSLIDGGGGDADKIDLSELPKTTNFASARSRMQTLIRDRA